jgi:molybdopterin-binding protein
MKPDISTLHKPDILTLQRHIGPRTSTPRPARRILSLMTLSARNRIEGKVVEIEFGGVMAHVVVRAGKNLIESVITKRSAEEMKLKVGDKVSAVIKSTEVMLEKS